LNTLAENLDEEEKRVLEMASRTRDAIDWGTAPFTSIKRAYLHLSWQCIEIWRFRKEIKEQAKELRKRDFTPSKIQNLQKEIKSTIRRFLCNKSPEDLKLFDKKQGINCI
jgi:hypothetical protein